LHRRHLTPARRAEVVYALRKIAVARAENREKQTAHLKRGADVPRLGKVTQTEDDNVVPFRSAPEPAHTRDQLAKEAGISARTASDFITIKEKGTKEDVTSSGKFTHAGDDNVVAFPSSSESTQTREQIAKEAGVSAKPAAKLPRTPSELLAALKAARCPAGCGRCRTKMPTWRSRSTTRRGNCLH
jgi:hypothetical protein